MKATIQPICPVIDAHNHLWGRRDLAPLVEIMNACGVQSYCELTANLNLEFKSGGTVFTQCDIKDFLDAAANFPGRFYGFTMVNFASPVDKPLFTDAVEFVTTACSLLREHVSLGAKGLKILKELGLHYRDAAGNLLRTDDERFDPIWSTAGELGVPVLMHQADPSAFFEPVTPQNEHYNSLKKYSAWSFADVSRFPRKHELLARRDNIIRRHPGTIFILPHVANHAENLDSVSQLLSQCPNVYIDFSARIDELGRKPQESRDFLTRWQDRVIFGTDMPASVEIYEAYYRFLQTRDEGIIPPDYDGTFGRYRWKITGLGLDEAVLGKIYRENILKIIPSLK